MPMTMPGTKTPRCVCRGVCRYVCCRVSHRVCRCVCRCRRTLGAALFAAAVLLAAAQPAGWAAVEFPGPRPGKAQAAIEGGRLRLANQVLAAEWTAGKTLGLSEFANRLSDARVSGAGQELFEIEAPPLVLKASEFEIAEPPRIVELHPNAKAARVAERIPGRAIAVTLKHAASGARVEWRAELRDDSHYVRQALVLYGPAEPGIIRRVVPLSVKATGAAVTGEVSGSPVIVGQTFLGVELPMCSPRVSGDRVLWEMNCRIRWDSQHPCELGTVIGVMPPGQTRRAFLSYLERERARESKPFLHYNCWYDLGTELNEKDVLNRIALFDEKFIKKRGIRLDSFVLDDGWDDPKTGFWAVDKTKFPSAFKGVCEAAKGAGSHLGLWVSPLGGYGGREQRLQRAREAGVVPAGSDFDLDQAAYYAWWLDWCSKRMTNEGVNYFKWDNAANFTSLAGIARELRKIDPSLFINTTVNTFPSPFFLNTMDATWRGGDDCGWFGPGSSRERYITYRDKELYARVVRKAPLYPINSIMHCAPVLGRFYQAKDISGADMKNDCRALFGMGPVLQELYIAPDLMQEAWWDQLAEAVRWAHANADVLPDAHWVGGDPGKLEIYGCAAWSPRKGTLMLRNPSDGKARIILDVAKVFELPDGAAQKYNLTSPYADQRIRKLAAASGTDTTLELEGLEVLVFDATPVPRE